MILRCVILILIMSPGIGLTQQIPGDLNNDGQVSFPDFLIFSTNFGKTGGDTISTQTDTVFLPIPKPEIFSSTANITLDNGLGTLLIDTDFRPKYLSGALSGPIRSRIRFSSIQEELYWKWRVSLRDTFDFQLMEYQSSGWEVLKPNSNTTYDDEIQIADASDWDDVRFMTIEHTIGNSFSSSALKEYGPFPAKTINFPYAETRVDTVQLVQTVVETVYVSAPGSSSNSGTQGITIFWDFDLFPDGNPTGNSTLSGPFAAIEVYADGYSSSVGSEYTFTFSNKSAIAEYSVTSQEPYFVLNSSWNGDSLTVGIGAIPESGPTSNKRLFYISFQTNGPTNVTLSGVRFVDNSEEIQLTPNLSGEFK